MQTSESVIDLPGSVDPGILRSFRTEAASELPGIRSGVLIFLQDIRSTLELNATVSDLKQFELRARLFGLNDVADISADCQQVLAYILNGNSLADEQDALRVLDLIAKMEATLLQMPLQEDDPDFSISGFLDESFERLTNGASAETVEDETASDVGFEIDEETKEIFRIEASELLENISANLTDLVTNPRDRDALWNIRRCAHTFKGAAGVIGLKEASELAHRVEDLLDRLAENEHEATPSVIELLTASTKHLNAMTLGCGTLENSKTLAQVYADFDRVIFEKRSLEDTPELPDPSSQSTTHNAENDSASTVKPPPAPIARVALDKLDELLNLTRHLAINRSSLLTVFGNATSDDSLGKLAPLFEEQRKITREIQEKLLQIRMVRFGMLTTRLNRAVHVTCQEEYKKADLIIENEDTEIDTQMLDSLVEPLLHLLRNAVVHGIEHPERRRLIAKPEKGLIRIRLENSFNEIVISVHDDGHGISAAKLLEKAVSSNVIDSATAASLTDKEALDLVFERGLTTANKLSMNAGRGVGMSIVRESIGSTGGSITVATQPQRGTTFTIKVPIVSHASIIESDDDEIVNDAPSPLLRDQTRDLTVLVIDDSSSMRQLIKRIVEDTGLKCIIATDGQNAVEILSDPENRPDLILTDLEMPNINGYELLEILKSDAETRDIPVVMVTSRQDESHRKKAFDLGAADFVTKPFDVNILVGIVKHQCQIAETLC